MEETANLKPVRPGRVLWVWGAGEARAAWLKEGRGGGSEAEGEAMPDRLGCHPRDTETGFNSVRPPGLNEVVQGTALGTVPGAQQPSADAWTSAVLCSSSV